MRIVHLSDLHVLGNYSDKSRRSTGLNGLLGRFELGAMGRAKRYAGLGGRLDALVSEVQRLRPDHVVISGDLTALGTEEELELAKAAIARFGSNNDVTVI